MKHALVLLAALAVVWCAWSGHVDIHHDGFLLMLGLASCVLVVLLCGRMDILDGETVPIWLGIRPVTRYAPWLLWEIVTANLDVSRRILCRRMPIHPQMTRIVPTQQTELAKVILANSITLTPGTVSVDVQERLIRVHALASSSADAASLGEMDRRVTKLEGRS